MFQLKLQHWKNTIVVIYIYIIYNIYINKIILPQINLPLSTETLKHWNASPQMRTHSVNSNALAFKLFRNKKTLNLLTSVVQIHFININNSLYRAKKIPKIFCRFKKSLYFYWKWCFQWLQRLDIIEYATLHVPSSAPSYYQVRPLHLRATSMGKRTYIK